MELALDLLDIQTGNQGRSCLVTMVKYFLIYLKSVCVCVCGSGPKAGLAVVKSGHCQLRGRCVRAQTLA